MNGTEFIKATLQASSIERPFIPYMPSPAYEMTALRVLTFFFRSALLSRPDRRRIPAYYGFVLYAMARLEA
jgi:hypothetical protein